MAGQDTLFDQNSAAGKPGSVEVIVLGLSRTAMYNALNKLGYKTYHMSEACLMTAKGHLTLWNGAIQAKHGPSPSLQAAHPSTSLSPYTSDDFHKLLQGYSAVTDAPTVLFPEELLAAYPSAHLILTTHPRGVDAWLRSMQNSYFRIGSWPIWSLLMKFDTFFSLPYLTLLRRIVEVWTGTPWLMAKHFSPVESTLRSFYADHNDRMRLLARNQDRQLLEFDPSKGWGPLCEFLGKDVPAESYPHYNEGDYVVDLHRGAVVQRLKATFGVSAIAAAVGIVAAVLVWGLTKN